MRKLVTLIVMLSVGFANAQVEKPADPNNFEQMTSEQIKSDVLSSKGIESGMYKEYITWRTAYNEYTKSLPKEKSTYVNEWEGWKIESSNFSSTGSKRVSYIVYSKKSAG